METLVDMRPSAVRLPARASATWQAHAIAQLAIAEAVEGGWRAVDGDPQFGLLLPGLPLPAGWYRLRARMPELQGRLVNPCLYPDYGDGIAEATRIDLGLVQASGRLDTVVRFAQPLHALRFDPTTAPAVFRLDDVSALAISAHEALWLMLRACLAPLLDESPADAAALSQAVRERQEAEGVDTALAELAPHYLRVGHTGSNAYATWTARADRMLHDRLSEASQLSIEKSEASPPLFSVLLHDEAGGDCSAAVDALRRQREADFEFVLSTEQAKRVDLADDVIWPSGSDLRIVEGDGSFAHRIAAARGHYVYVVSSADRLHDCALGILRLAIQSCPEALLFYSDEDCLGADGRREKPYFKPACDSLLFLQHDFVGRSALVRRDVLTGTRIANLDSQVPWFDVYAQIVIEDADNVVHVPHVLKHNVGDRGPLSAPFVCNEYDVQARAAVLNRHLARRNAAASVVATASNGLSVRCLPVGRGSVDIIIPTRDRIDLLSKCVSALFERTHYQEYRITIVDNGSEEPESHEYFTEAAKNPRICVLPYDHPFNYSAINNFAAAQSDADFLVLLNNDIEVMDGAWLDELLALAAQPCIGAVGAKLYYPDGTLQHAGVILGVGGVAAHAYAHAPHAYPGQYGRAMFVQQYSAVTAACLAVRRAAYMEVNGLDEKISVAFNDVDFCLRLQARGYRNAWTPHARLIHHESASRGLEDNPMKQARFAEEVRTMLDRWSGLLIADDAYSPNLSLEGSPFEVDPDRHASDVVRCKYSHTHNDVQV